MKFVVVVGTMCVGAITALAAALTSEEANYDASRIMYFKSSR